MSWRTRLALVLLAALAVGAILVPLLAGTDPRAIGDVLALRFVPPAGTDVRGGWHLLGTDRFGRDVFARMMLAARISLLVRTAGLVPVVHRLARAFAGESRGSGAGGRSARM